MTLALAATNAGSLPGLQQKHKRGLNAVARNATDLVAILCGAKGDAKHMWKTYLETKLVDGWEDMPDYEIRTAKEGGGTRLERAWDVLFGREQQSWAKYNRKRKGGSGLESLAKAASM